MSVTAALGQMYVAVLAARLEIVRGTFDALLRHGERAAASDRIDDDRDHARGRAPGQRSASVVVMDVDVSVNCTASVDTWSTRY